MLASWFVEQCVLVCAYMRAYAMCIIINFKCPNLTARCSLTLTPPKNEQQYALCKHHTYETDRIRTKWKKYQSTLWLRLHIISSARWVFKTDAFFSIFVRSLEIKCWKSLTCFFFSWSLSFTLELLVRSFFYIRLMKWTSLNILNIWNIRYGGEKGHLFKGKNKNRRHLIIIHLLRSF